MIIDLDPHDLTEKALLITILKGLQKMQLDLTNLSSNVTTLQAAVVALGPALTANADLATKTITALEAFAAQVATLPATQTAIDGLNASIASTLATLQAEATQVAATNAATQAELDKIITPTPAPTP